MAFFDITLICKHCLKMYVYSKTELYRSRILKAIVLAVYIHTYRHNQKYYHAGTPVCGLPCPISSCGPTEVALPGRRCNSQGARTAAMNNPHLSVTEP